MFARRHNDLFPTSHRQRARRERSSESVTWYTWLTVLLTAALIVGLSLLIWRTLTNPSPPVMDNPPPMIFPAP